MTIFQKHKRSLCWLLCLVGWQAALANDTLRTVQLTSDFIVLGKKGEVGVLKKLPADSGTMTVGEVKFAPDDLFQPWRKGQFQFGYSHEPHWLRLNLTDTIDRRLILEIDNPYLREVQFFQVADGETIDTSLAGSDYPFNGRKHWNFRDTVRIGAGDTVQCLINLRHDRSLLNFNLYLWDSQVRAKADRTERLVLIVFFCLVFVYLLMLGIAIYLTRFRYFWFYFLYVLLVSGFIFADIGLGFQIFWPGSPYLQQVSSPVLANAYLIAGTLFVMAHFYTRRSYRFHDRVMRVLLWAAAAMIAAALFLPLLPSLIAHLYAYLHSFLFIVTCLVFFWLAGTALSRNDRMFPGWLLVGFLIHGLSVIYASLESFKIVPAISLSDALAENGILLAFHTPLVLMLGLLVEMGIVLAIGMKRFKMMYAESQRLSKALAQQRQQNLNALGLGMEAEQRRIAQDLHDGLGGGIAAAKFKLEKILTENGHAPGLGEVVRDLTDLHQELREIAHNLMPKHLDKQGLLPAIEQLVRQMETADNRLKINFFNNADLGNMNELARVYLYRIVQELLGNLYKHAAATEAWLQFVRHEDHLLITMEDNGKGFDLTQAQSSGGIGLANLRYRVEDALGGKFSVESAAGQGTLISMEIPMRNLEG